ncbi:MAG: M3 family oligoendopeptidase [Ruminococcaceae bacterium]|nr:M3 family oligoendopeptidase [Oscillospiraceae bacterium]
MKYTKISEMAYVRVSKDSVIEQIKDIIARIENAKSSDELLSLRNEYNTLSEHVGTMARLASTRLNLNSRDEFYTAEMDYYNSALPEIQMYDIKFTKAFLDSPYLEEAKKELNPLVITMMELSLKCADERVLEEMQEENRLTTEYSKFVSELTYDFRGEKLTLGALRKYMQDSDRETRREAYNALGKSLGENSDYLDGIYDKMVKVRDKMAKKLGYENYVGLGYNLMQRTAYDKEAVKVFRENVLTDLVPVITELKKKIAQKLGIDELKLYDDSTYSENDPKPILDAEGILAAGKEMYHEMSPETREFIDMMFESDAFDVLPREGKWTGGYMTFFPDYRQPFIFANFNGTTADVDVITHEAGHAFAYYVGRNEMLPETQLGGMETAESHSMSMEFFAWKYMDKFFGERADAYKYKHLFSALAFIPYGVIVDYFQQIVYENPEMTPAQRNEVWKSLEKQFRPYMNADGIEYLEKGTRWQYQNHIFQSPFYYIDYCLAQVVAFEFLQLSLEDYEGALRTYIDHAGRTGNYNFTELIKMAGLKSPFESGALSQVARMCRELLEKLG